MILFPDFAPNSRKEWRLLFFQSNLRKQIRHLPKILKFVRIIQYYSKLFTGVLTPHPTPPINTDHPPTLSPFPPQVSSSQLSCEYLCSQLPQILHARKRNCSREIRQIVAFIEKKTRYTRVLAGIFSLARANMSSPGRPAEALTLPCRRKWPCVSHPPKEILRTQIIIFWEKM